MSFSCLSTLIFGGARSGKSGFAERLVLESGLAPVYVATAEAGDGEMTERIASHRSRRGAEWTNLEEPMDLAGTLVRENRPGRALLVDCLTLWLSNHFFADHDLEAETGHLTAVIAGLTGPVVFVSNEVGFGIVPDTRLSRDFRDAQGRLNQAIAAACERVIFVAAGLPLVMKPNQHGSLTL